MDKYLSQKAPQIKKFYPEICTIKTNINILYVHIMVSMPPIIAVKHMAGVIKKNKKRKYYPFPNIIFWRVKGICTGRKLCIYGWNP